MRRTEVDMAVREQCKEAKESMWTELDEREREGLQGAAEPGLDPTTLAMEETDRDANVIDVSWARQQPKLVEEEQMLQEKYGNMKDLEEQAFSILFDLGMVNLHANPANNLTLDLEEDN